MFTFGMAGGDHHFDPLILLLVALLLDAYLGEMSWVFRVVKHPVAALGDLVATLEKKLNREKRSEMDRTIRGTFLAFFIVLLVGTVGAGVAWLSLHHALGWIVELILLTVLLAGRSLYDHVAAVAKAMETGLEPGRAAVSHIVGRDPAELDEHGVCRAAIESLAENFGDGIVAPVFWYILFGFPGLAVYKAVNTMDSMIGYRNTRYRAFGMAAARLDDILNLIPARLAGLFFVFAAFFVPTANPKESLKTMLRDSGKHRSVNAGWPEAAMAGALGLALAGPRRYADKVVKDAWMGGGTAKADIKDIHRALYMYLVASLINAAWVAALAIVRFDLL